MNSVFLGIGTNIGNRFENIQKAKQALSNFSQIVACSSVYETDAWGYTEQAPFLNLVVEMNTSLAPLRLLKQLKKTEKQLGRIKSFRWGPRLIDLDILFYNNRIVRLPLLTIPHKELHNRAFVLVPLAEIAPDYIHPVLNKTVRELLNELTTTEGIIKCE